ncbi:phosphate metabolism protein 7 [Coemansia sp. BCRC 34301]|nr:phosphate metabolism protein 7 [Coemansia sp. BCRC 34301]
MVDTSQVSVENPSLATFLSAFVFYFVVSTAIFSVFCAVRRKKKHIYAPRTGAVLYCRRAEPVYESTSFSWIAATFRVDGDAIFRVAGPDAAMFMHSLRSGMQVFIAFAAIALPTLLAVDIYSRGEAQSLDRLTMSNIEDYDGRVWAHVVMFAAFSAIALHVTLGDLWYYIDIRKRHLQDPNYQRQLRANTVIVTGIPSLDNTEQALYEMFGSLPGGIMKITPCLSSPTMRRLVEMRKWHVDSIAYHCMEIVQLNNEICTLRASMPEAAETSTSAIIVFNSQKSAHEAARPPASVKWYQRALIAAYWPRFSDIDPTEVNWSGVNVGARLRRFYELVSRIFIFIIITLWIFPVVFISALSKVTQLSQLGPFKDISEWPTPLAGLIQGVFPPLILALLQWAVPSLFRGKSATVFMARFVLTSTIGMPAH